MTADEWERGFSSHFLVYQREHHSGLKTITCRFKHVAPSRIAEIEFMSLNDPGHINTVNHSNVYFVLAARR